MAPSRSATSITWSLGTNRNSASLSTNFLMSQGQATRSTLTCSRVIHFIGMFSFWLHRIASTTKQTKIDVKRDRSPGTSGLYLNRFARNLRIERVIDELSPFQGDLV